MNTAAQTIAEPSKGENRILTLGMTDFSIYPQLLPDHVSELTPRFPRVAPPGMPWWWDEL
jgi:hypothetical protein